jgi:calcineurin-like phosphoesterase family protein
MAIWFTSDTHYGHKNIIKYCGRPFADTDEMDEAMIARWNEVVSPKDYVFHLGDFAMGPNQNERVPALRKRLNGGITLILGNHDKTKAFYRVAGFEDVREYWEGKLPPQGGIRVLMAHHPPERPLPEHGRFDLILCGHVHEEWKHKGKVVNVGVDQWNFTPVSLNTLCVARDSL